MGLLNASQLGDQSQVIQGLTLWAVDTKGRVQTLVIWSGLEQEGRGCVRGFSGLHERSWLAPRWMLNKKSDTQAAAFISFRQRLGDRLFLSAPSALCPKDRNMVSVLSATKNCFIIGYSLAVSWTQAPFTFRTGCFEGAAFRQQSKKVEGYMWGPNSLLLR